MQERGESPSLRSQSSPFRSHTEATEYLERNFADRHTSFHCHILRLLKGFPGRSVVENLPANAGDTRDLGSIPGLGRSAGGEQGNPLQYSYLGNSMNRGDWKALVHTVTNSWTHTRLLQIFTVRKLKIHFPALC